MNIQADPEEVMTAHVNGIDIHYEKIGSGRALVMLHGNGEDHTIFDEAVGILKNSFTCYCLDSRAHGQSTPGAPLHYDEMARDVIGFIEQEGLNDVVLYGFSDGGIAGLLAAAACGRITALIVSGANLTPRGVKLSLRLTMRVIYCFKRDPKIALMLREPDISHEDLKKITVPALVLAGSKDVIKGSETRRIAASIPGATLRILEGEDHGSYIVHSEKIAGIIRDFVRQHN